MSVTLQKAAGVNVVFDLVKSSGDSQVFQNVGSSFTDTRILTASQNVGKTATAKSKVTIRVPYTVTIGAAVVTKYKYYTITGTVPEDAPFAGVDEDVYMLGTLAVHALTKDLVSRRRFSQS